MTKNQFINISQKYGLVIIENDDYCVSKLPMINKKDLERIAAFADFNDENGMVNVYNGFTFNYIGGQGIKINFYNIDAYNTGTATVYEKIVKEVMERYNKILPLIKTENVNEKLKDIEADFA